MSKTDYPISKIFDDLYHSTCKETLAGKMREIEIIQSIPRSAAEYLFNLVCEHRPTTVIEVGMAWGFSSVAICAALRDLGEGVNVIMDPYQLQTWEGVGMMALKHFGLEAHAEVHVERSDLFLPNYWKSSAGRASFAFIDGDHRIDAVFVDFYYVNKILPPGAVVVFDDFQFHSVASVVQYAMKNFHYERLQCPEARFVVLKKLRPDERGWSDYGSF